MSRAESAGLSVGVYMREAMLKNMQDQAAGHPAHEMLGRAAQMTAEVATQALNRKPDPPPKRPRRRSGRRASPLDAGAISALRMVASGELTPADVAAELRKAGLDEDGAGKGPGGGRRRRRAVS